MHAHVLSYDEPPIEVYQETYLMIWQNEVPTNKDPRSPGPLVNAIEVRSLNSIFASLVQYQLVGTIFS